MEWLLGVSVLINVLFGVVLAVLTYCVVVKEQEAEHNLAEWKVWESRFYEAQGMLIEDHNLFVSPIQGAYGRMVITKHKANGE